MSCIQTCYEANNCLELANEILELKKPITGEVIEDKMLLIRNNEVIGELPITSSNSTIVFLDAFNNIII